MFAPHIITREARQNNLHSTKLTFHIEIRVGIELFKDPFRESDHVHEREKSPFHFGWMKRSTLLYMHVIDGGRGEFRTATGAGDECREVLHGVFGFGGALGDVEPTNMRPCGSTCLFEGW